MSVPAAEFLPKYTLGLCRKCGGPHGTEGCPVEDVGHRRTLVAHLTGDPEKGYHQWHFEGHCLSDAEKLSLAETVLQQVPEAVRRLSGFGKERK